jgi:hypothetical protein
MGNIQDTHREQATQFPETIEESLSDDTRLRFIDAHVDQFDPLAGEIACIARKL